MRTARQMGCRVRKGALNEHDFSTRTRQHRAHHDRDRCRGAHGAAPFRWKGLRSLTAPLRTLVWGSGSQEGDREAGSYGMAASSLSVSLFDRARFLVPTAILPERRAQPRSRLAAAVRVQLAIASPGHALTAASTGRGWMVGTIGRDERQDVILDWAASEACGSTASPCIRSGLWRARYPNPSCTSEGKAQLKTGPLYKNGL